MNLASVCTSFGRLAIPSRTRAHACTHTAGIKSRRSSIGLALLSDDFADEADSSRRLSVPRACTHARMHTCVQSAERWAWTRIHRRRPGMRTRARAHRDARMHSRTHARGCTHARMHARTRSRTHAGAGGCDEGPIGRSAETRQRTLVRGAHTCTHGDACACTHARTHTRGCMRVH